MKDASEIACGVRITFDLLLPCLMATTLQNYGKSIERSTNSSRTELVNASNVSFDNLIATLLQGFQVSDDEINMDLTTFKSLYANSGDSVECVWLSLLTHLLSMK